MPEIRQSPAAGPSPATMKRASRNGARFSNAARRLAVDAILAGPGDPGDALADQRAARRALDPDQDAVGAGLPAEARRRRGGDRRPRRGDGRVGILLLAIGLDPRDQLADLAIRSRPPRRRRRPRLRARNRSGRTPPAPGGLRDRDRRGGAAAPAPPARAAAAMRSMPPDRAWRRRATAPRPTRCPRLKKAIRSGCDPRGRPARARFAGARRDRPGRAWREGSQRLAAISLAAGPGPALGEQVDELAPLRGQPVRAIGGLRQHGGDHVVEAHRRHATRRAPGRGSALFGRVANRDGDGDGHSRPSPFAR